MAKAITKLNKSVPDPVEEQRQAIEQLMEMTADSRNALMETLEILQRLQEYGVLEALRAMLNQGHRVSALAIQQVNKPGTYNMIKNVFAMVEIMSALDLSGLGAMTGGVTKGIENASESLKTNEQINVWGLMKILKDPDVNAALTAGVSFLKGIGEHLRMQASEQASEAH
ncbi:DUF1641 domain-containing protein [Pullulanibacillus sp. KACC 23026]|uniref:DUF1641 domain-containing protein n=1 Tax=Pullulanibacillus sp. KACC 23026 TaxID=3028315 RepID=UPI0023AEDF0A|nr:DUF1641 domain-containing protein [Pullulanibacillus sp. KACC 23026]WEG12051.1 DUF1641 domain-containing protein [Pullulanibacillus sp. KACC 23026]